MKYRIAAVSDSDLPQWHELAAEYGTVFNHPAWLSLWADQTEIIGVFDPGKGDLIGGFMLYRMKLKGIDALTNVPLTPHCGLFLQPIDGHQTTIHSKRKQVIEAVSQFLATRSEKIRTLSFPPDWVDLQPFNWSGYKILTRYTYTLELSIDQASLFEGMSSKTRNAISKAERDGVEVTDQVDLDEVLDILESSYARNRASFQREQFERLIQSGSSAGILECEVAKFNGKSVATGIFLYDSKRTYYIAGGYRQQNGHNGAGALAIWSGILAAQKRGAEVFDFEGSMIPEVEKFFRGFGGQMVRYHQVNKAPFWLEVLLKFKRRGEF